jgi:hypothetical protein
MSLSRYDVLLVDCTASLDAGQKDAITKILTMWFSKAVSFMVGKRPKLAVTWGTIASDPDAIDIVVYFVDDLSNNALCFMPYYEPPSPDEAVDLRGLTRFSEDSTWKTNSQGNEIPGTRKTTVMYASEVYVKRCKDAPEMAMFAFHEAMHNQLGKNIDIHVEAGGGIAEAKIAYGTIPNDKNLKAMARSISKVRRRQWLEGYSKLRQTGFFRPQYCTSGFAYA